MKEPQNSPKLRADGSPDLHATLPFPEQSDMRGFSYRAPQRVNEPETDPKSMEAAWAAKEEFSHEASEETNASDAEAEEDPTESEDVLEMVTGGLRADTPDENEYDDSTAHAQAEAKKARHLH